MSTHSLCNDACHVRAILLVASFVRKFLSWTFKSLPAYPLGYAIKHLGHRSEMDIADQDRTDITNRLKRARGQIDGVLAMLDEGRSCRDVVMQLGAASTAIERTALKMVAIGFRQSYSEGSDVDAMTTEDLEKLLLSIA